MSKVRRGPKRLDALLGIQHDFGELTEICVQSHSRLPFITSPRQNVSANRKPACFLLIENDQFTSDVISSLLTTMGVMVKVAQNGVAGIRAMGESNFDAVIVDVTLPDHYGVDVARKVLAVDPGMPLALISVAQEYLDAILESGFACAATICKPIRSGEVAKAVDSLLTCIAERIEAA